MKKILLFLSLSVLLALSLAAETITVGGGSNSVTVLSSSGTETLLQYQIGRFEQTRVQIGGEDWYHIDLPKEGFTQEKGAPQLPVCNRSIIIDPTAKMRLELLDVQYQDFPVAVARQKVSSPATSIRIPFLTALGMCINGMLFTRKMWRNSPNPTS